MIVLTGLIKLSMVVDVNKMVSSISLFFSFFISKYILSNLYYVFFDSINFLGFFIERDVFLFFIFCLMIGFFENYKIFTFLIIYLFILISAYVHTYYLYSGDSFFIIKGNQLSNFLDVNGMSYVLILLFGFFLVYMVSFFKNFQKLE